jgi:hypothetical protein
MSEPRVCDFVNSTDERYITSQTDAQQRAAMTDSVMRHRRADKLRAGDPLPALALTRLKDGGQVQLAELVGPKPLMLVFGSYT